MLRPEIRQLRESDASWSLLRASLAACLALAIYAAITGDSRLAFLPWNLLLAWVPYLLSATAARIARRIPPRRGGLILPTALWLLFLPNAPYVITDLVHLARSPAGLWPLEALLILGFAAVALALGVRSLYTMHAIVRARWGRLPGRTFVGVVVLLTGLGVWVGRVLRWNSWDALVDPMGTFGFACRALLSPWEHRSVYGFSLAFGMAFFAVYAVHKRMRADLSHTAS